MNIVKRSQTITRLEDVRRPSSNREDKKIRSSTGVVFSPLAPVDGVELFRSRVAMVEAERRGMAGEKDVQQPPTSLELLRQLEACVRELLDISAQGHQ